MIVHTDQARIRLQRWGLAPDRISVLPHGLLHVRDGEATPWRSDQKLRLLQFGKIKPYKGVDLLLRALASLRAEERARIDVRIAGEAHMDVSPLHRLIDSNELTDCVELQLGFVEEAHMKELLEWAHVALFPYREIDASGVAMAAIGNGLPALATDVGGFSELMGDGEGCALVPPGDVSAIASVIRSWLDAPEKLEALRGGMARRAPRYRAGRTSLPDA